jgi:tRNA(fMet)-specific endonuclease VapC
MPLRLALDTNRYSDFHRGDATVAALLEQAEEILIPLPVVGELRVGFAGGSRGAENERVFAQFLSRAGVSVLYPDLETTQHYSNVFHQLRRQGTPIPVNDMWIAALCLQHDLTLYARDAHFDHLSQLKRL